MPRKNDVSVLIVGGGPVGLTLATELGLRGVRCLLVEQRDGSIAFPKMNMVSTRSMEFCRRWGIAEAVKAESWPETHPLDVLFVTSMTGHELGRFRYPSYRDRRLDYTPEGNRRCPQIYFDPILRARAQGLPGVALRYRVRLDGFAEDADGVVASLTDLETGRAETVRADYLVGCDGDASAVRERLGIEMKGRPVLSHNMNIFFVSDELPRLHDKGWAWAHWVVGPEGQWGNIVAVDGRRLWRLSMTGVAADAEFGIDEASAAIRRAVGRDFAFEVKSVLPWTRRELVAERYRVGRAFIAGDAAHLLSPTGGFGMNTGIGDAVDLAWKLAGAVHGWAGPRLLDAYQLERRPIAERNVAEATRNFRKVAALPTGPDIAADTPEGEALRARCRATLMSGGYNQEYEAEGLILGYRYDRSPLVCSDGSAPPPDDVSVYVPTARPGSRAPHAWVAPGVSTLDLFGGGFVVLRLGRKPPDAEGFCRAAAACRLPLTVHDIPDPKIRELYEQPLALVRPDGHVAWRGERIPDDPGVVIDTIRGGATAARGQWGG